MYQNLVDGLNKRFCFIFAAKRIKLLAERAKSLVPDITSINFKKKEKKSKKKKVNANHASFFDIAKQIYLHVLSKNFALNSFTVICDFQKKKNKVEQEEPPTKVITSRADITDDVIVSRIDEKLLKKVCIFSSSTLLMD